MNNTTIADYVKIDHVMHIMKHDSTCT